MIRLLFPGGLHEGVQYLGALYCVEYLVVPTAFKSCQNILFRDIFDTRLVVILRIVGIYYAVDLVLGFAQPILLKVVKDDFDSGFAARQEAAVRDCYGQ